MTIQAIWIILNIIAIWLIAPWHLRRFLEEIKPKWWLADDIGIVQAGAGNHDIPSKWNIRERYAFKSHVRAKLFITLNIPRAKLITQVHDSQNDR